MDGLDADDIHKLRVVFKTNNCKVFICKVNSTRRMRNDSDFPLKLHYTKKIESQMMMSDCEKIIKQAKRVNEIVEQVLGQEGIISEGGTHTIKELLIDLRDN